MSNNSSSKIEAINQLYATIKTKFEQDGVLQDVRCLLQSKMVEMMMGKGEKNALSQRPHTSSKSSADKSGGDTRMALLHQLIMEYLKWRGFHYSAQIFSMESTCENAVPMRQCLEAILGQFEHKSLPILLQMVMQQMEDPGRNQNNNNNNESP